MAAKRSWDVSSSCYQCTRKHIPQELIFFNTLDVSLQGQSQLTTALDGNYSCTVHA